MALIFFARYHQKAISAGFKRFDEIQQIGLAGTGKTDDFVFYSIIVINHAE